MRKDNEQMGGDEPSSDAQSSGRYEPMATSGKIKAVTVPDFAGMNLIQQATEGSESALEELISLLRPPLMRQAMRRLGNQEMAADITQDTLLVVIEQLPQFKVQNIEYRLGGLLAWARTILTNRCIDILRAANRHPILSQEEIPTERRLEFQDCSRSLEERVTERIFLTDALNRLTPHLKLILVLYYLEDYTLQKIADRLNLPLGTVYARKQKARQQLMLYFAEQTDNSQKSASIQLMKETRQRDTIQPNSQSSADLPPPQNGDGATARQNLTPKRKRSQLQPRSADSRDQGGGGDTE